MSLFQLNSNGKVSIHGHLDRDTLAKNWWNMLSSDEKSALQQLKRCVLDLSSVERIDSAGLAWLINAVRDGKKQGVQVILNDVPEKLMKLAKISDVDTLLPLE
ncbi:STAS domain-containing protein [Alteromonas pelagimontana]|uniref:STAS domain-containing protein n=1 Tax=Alteromonas pelagimontana TaxID=1858656 RepID=A0A6M4MBQ7_9ALTE|nr:STAS domain-containing protein [Alteromonas pelagimontana]QJR80238.1 STAS domain-containing protein [Alteromonas pelagimontana]